MLLEACIGNARVLTRRGGRRMWLLDEDAALLWDLHKAGLGTAEIAALLASRFGDGARRHLRQLHEAWAASGLAGDGQQGADGEHPHQPLASFAEPEPVRAHADARGVMVAGRRILLSCESTALRERFRDLFPPVMHGGSEADHAVMDRMALCGDETGWTLRVNGREAARGRGEGDALLAALATLTELGCRTAERLMVLHGAGLIGPQGRCLLLAAPGGSGKTTLAMALEAEVFRLDPRVCGVE